MTTARVTFLLRACVSGALIVLVARKVNWSGFASVLRQVDASWAAVGSCLTLALIAALAVRWRLFLRQQAIEIPFRTIFSLTWAGQFFNSVLPGSTGGDVVKIYQLCRLAPGRKSAAAATVLSDRLSALLALLVLAGGGLVIEPALFQPLVARGVPMAGIAILLVVALVSLLLVARMAARAAWATPWLGPVQRTLAAVKTSLAPNRTVLAAISLAFAVHLVNFFIVYCFAHALRIRMSYAQVLLMMPVVLLFVMLPITVNGHGLREVLLIYYFTQLHVPLAGPAGAGVNEAVIALSVLGVVNDLLWSVPGGLWYLLAWSAPNSGSRV